MKAILSLSITLLMITFVGCNTTKTATMSTQDVTGSYTVSALNGNEIKTVLPKFTLDLSEQAIRGQTGCNSFFGVLQMDKNQLSFDQMGVSEMECPGAGIMERERAFLDVLHQTKSYVLEDKILSFYSESGIKILEAKQDLTK